MHNRMILRELLSEAERQVDTVSRLVRRKRHRLMRDKNGAVLDHREFGTLLSIRAAHESHRDDLKTKLDEYDATLAGGKVVHSLGGSGAG